MELLNGRLLIPREQYERLIEGCQNTEVLNQFNEVLRQARELPSDAKEFNHLEWVDQSNITATQFCQSILNGSAVSVTLGRKGR